ncbi:hypothetical protein EASG_04432 [Escherichia coli H383]|nr:hypothetical protein EASG_04432 [Escherichia coli H383]
MWRGKAELHKVCHMFLCQKISARRQKSPCANALL